MIKAGTSLEKDKLNGVSSIMMGQIINAGTGMYDVYLDEEKLISERLILSQEDDSAT